ncbi:GtrA family protein [Pedobacter sp. ASV12]|uniref:GtrA family protein n=1 Tax=Pedobacter sp. ASV12 TaxID=2795120 RepID=UPI0018ECDDC6|nr:GtrA family protein [Pedobacter sp. ASV12]
MQRVRDFILSFIDFFYPPFRRLIGIQTFRYAFCGGSNALLNLLVFSVSYNFLFTDKVIYVLGFAISRYIAAYLLALSISFPIGFCLNKYVVFQSSNLLGHVQFVRYASLTVTNIFLDYFLLHLLVGYFGFWATPSQAIIIVVLSLFSYFCQTYFSFKTVRKEA